MSGTSLIIRIRPRVRVVPKGNLDLPFVPLPPTYLATSRYSWNTGFTFFPAEQFPWFLFREPPHYVYVIAENPVRHFWLRKSSVHTRSQQKNKRKDRHVLDFRYRQPTDIESPLQLHAILVDLVPYVTLILPTIISKHKKSKRVMFGWLVFVRDGKAHLSIMRSQLHASMVESAAMP